MTSLFSAVDIAQVPELCKVIQNKPGVPLHCPSAQVTESYLKDMWIVISVSTGPLKLPITIGGIAPRAPH